MCVRKNVSLSHLIVRFWPHHMHSTCKKNSFESNSWPLCATPWFATRAFSCMRNPSSPLGTTTHCTAVCGFPRFYSGLVVLFMALARHGHRELLPLHRFRPLESWSTAPSYNPWPRGALTAAVLALLLLLLGFLVPLPSPPSIFLTSREASRAIHAVTTRQATPGTYYHLGAPLQSQSSWRTPLAQSGASHGGPMSAKAQSQRNPSGPMSQPLLWTVWCAVMIGGALLVFGRCCRPQPQWAMFMTMGRTQLKRPGGVAPRAHA